MKITTDFECGGGKRLTQLEGNHWRVEANGDPSGYNKYFCVRVEADADEAPATLALDVHPDADLGDADRREGRLHRIRLVRPQDEQRSAGGASFGTAMHAGGKLVQQSPVCLGFRQLGPLRADYPDGHPCAP